MITERCPKTSLPCTHCTEGCEEQIESEQPRDRPTQIRRSKQSYSTYAFVGAQKLFFVSCETMGCDGFAEIDKDLLPGEPNKQVAWQKVFAPAGWTWKKDVVRCPVCSRKATG